MPNSSPSARRRTGLPAWLRGLLPPPGERRITHVADLSPHLLDDIGLGEFYRRRR